MSTSKQPFDSKAYISIICSLISLAAFFLPWLGGGFMSVTGTDLIRGAIMYAQVDPISYILMILLLIPVFSIVIIAGELKRTTKSRNWSRKGKIIVFATVICIIVYTLLTGGFKAFTYGWYLEMASAAVLFASIFIKRRSA